MKFLKDIAVFLREKDRAQDLAEYCLITAFVALVALGIFLYVSGGVQGMWSSINASLAAGNRVTTGGSTTGNP